MTTENVQLLDPNTVVEGDVIAIPFYFFDILNYRVLPCLSPPCTVAKCILLQSRK